MMFKKTLTAAFIAGIASLPMQSAQAWWGGPGYGGSGSEWGPFLSLIHISEPTRQLASSRMPSSA